ncbi:MAG: energy transducer TonB [Steroidobacteraceae bacterium]
MAAYTQHDSQFFSRRIIVLFIACAVQVVGFLALSLGLKNKVMKVDNAPIQTNIVQQVQKHNQPPPPPPPQMQRPPVVVPPPEVSINVPQQTNSTAITDVTNKKVVALPPPKPAPRRIVRTYARLNVRNSPSTDDYYPPVSRRLGEQGTTEVYVCAGPSGRVVGQPKVQRSSGSSRLDQAAVRWAAHANFYPGTTDGKPVETCVNFNVKFVLQ